MGKNTLPQADNDESRKDLVLKRQVGKIMDRRYADVYRSPLAHASAVCESRPVVMFDLDSTLADTRPRWHLGPRELRKATWVSYAQACHLDLPLMEQVELARAFHAAGWAVHVVSGRDESAWDATVEWLDRYGVPWDVLALAGPQTYHSTWKLAWAIAHRRYHYDIRLHVDDWPDVGRELREAGFRCLVVDSGYHVPLEEFPERIGSR